MTPYKSKFSENNEEIERLKREIQSQKEEQARLDQEIKKIKQDSIENLKFLLPRVKTEEEESNIRELISEMEKEETNVEDVNRRLDIMFQKIIDNWGK